MACAIHGVDSLCNQECPGYIRPSTSDDQARQAASADNGDARDTMQRCYDLMHTVMTTHEETRGHIAEWVRTVEERVNALAGECNRLNDKIASMGHGEPYKPSDDSNAKADNEHKPQ
jgi:hypothetical protein